MDSSATLIWAVLFGALGMGYFIYGKRQRRGSALVSGIALCLFPYFVSDAVLIVLVGVALTALPYFFRY